MTSPNTYTQQPDRIDICTQEALEVFGDVAATGSRFNLVDPEASGAFVHDVLTDTHYEGFDRIMIVDKHLFDKPFYDEVNDAGVQQLPLIYSGTDVVGFGVPTGIRPLANERVHTLDSTGSYIGDKEILLDAVHKMEQVWRRTGQLIKDPVEHMGVVSFVEGDKEGFPSESALYLCPPYGTIPADNLYTVHEYFLRNTQHIFEQRGKQVPAQRMNVAADILQEVGHEFLEGAA